MESVDSFLPSAFVWYVWVQAFALAGSVIASGWLRSLPDRGYAVGKPLGIVLGAVIFWLIVALGIMPNGVPAAGVALALLWGLAVWMRGHDTKPVGVWVVLVEVVFAMMFLGWSVVRAYKPEIWDGEKRMEIMMVTAILRSERFPPHDAWMSGYTLSYYYLGYVVLALLTKLSNLPAAVTFNLGHATFFALTFVSAIGVGYALGAQAGSRFDLRGAGTGMLAAVMLTLMGNLGGALGILKCTNALPVEFWGWLDVREIATRTYVCRGAVPSQFDWWWDWSRVVKDYALNGKPQIVITETPIFSFIFADNHPHVMALPLVVAVLGLSFAALRDRQLLELSTWRERVGFILLAIVLGALGFMNAWDVPAYTAIFVAAVGLGAWQRGERLAVIAVKLAGLFALSYFLFLPWRMTFAGQAQGIAANLFNSTRLAQLVVMFAPLLVVWVALIVHQAAQLQTPWRSLTVLIGLGVALCISLAISAVALAIVNPDSRALLSAAFSAGELNAQGEQVRQRLFERLLNPWTPLLLSLGVASCMWLVARTARAPSSAHSMLFTLLLFATGGLLVLGAEFFYVRDPFNRRLNTVFKFYYQAWTLWSIAGALALAAITGTRRYLSAVMGGVASLLIVAGLLWPAFAIPARTNFFAQTPTLNGANFLRTVLPNDAAIIDWLNAHVPGTPVVIEAGSIESFRREGRISAFTGLPTVLGWGRHQHQWRGEHPEVARRKKLVDLLYTTTDWHKASAILREFNIEYVVVGDVERALFPSEGLAKFAHHCLAVFRSESSSVYRCA